LLNFFGPRWAFVLQDEILAEPIPSAVIFPSREVALRSLEVTPYEVAKLRAQQIKESKQCSKTYVLKPFFTAANHKRVRSICCGRVCVTSLDVEDTTPTVVLREMPSGVGVQSPRPTHAPPRDVETAAST